MVDTSVSPCSRNSAKIAPTTKTMPRGDRLTEGRPSHANSPSWRPSSRNCRRRRALCATQHVRLPSTRTIPHHHYHRRPTTHCHDIPLPAASGEGDVTFLFMLCYGTRAFRHPLTYFFPHLRYPAKPKIYQCCVCLLSTKERLARAPLNIHITTLSCSTTYYSHEFPLLHTYTYTHI